MSEQYTANELADMSPEEVIELFLRTEIQHNESQFEASNACIELRKELADLQGELLDLAKKHESAGALMSRAKEAMDMMDCEIEGHTAGIFRRDRMIASLKRQVEEQSK